MTVSTGPRNLVTDNFLTSERKSLIASLVSFLRSSHTKRQESNQLLHCYRSCYLLLSEVAIFFHLLVPNMRFVLPLLATLSSVAGKPYNVSAFTVYSNGSARQVYNLSAANNNRMIDPDYPGTAVERLMKARERVASLTTDDLNGNWPDVRRKILWAGGLRDLPDAVPGQGYTGHSFNDFNHVDLTCMIDQASDNENDGSVKGIAIGNRLGNGIRVASLPELGPGGSWSTCALGCNKEPPQDVAHIQFQARIAFKLVWVPNANFDTFVLVDDEGNLLAQGKPNGNDLPALRERQMNYRIVAGSKYAKAADLIASTVASE